MVHALTPRAARAEMARCARVSRRIHALGVFRDMCREDGVEPGKQFSGKFNVRISPDLHAAIAAAAAADGKSLNQWVSDELRACVAGSG